jgi:hypothetical protein
VLLRDLGIFENTYEKFIQNKMMKCRKYLPCIYRILEWVPMLSKSIWDFASDDLWQVYVGSDCIGVVKFADASITWIRRSAVFG